MKIVFFGSSSYVLPVIQNLKKNFNIPLTITTEKKTTDPLVSFCQTNNIPFKSIKAFDENLKSYILGLKPDLGIIADFGLIIPNKVIGLFKYGILNIHPSLLPKYRGPTPVPTAILSGDKKTGVSIIKIDEEVDHGPVLFQKEEEIKNDDTSQSLLERLFKIGADNLPETISKYVSNEINITEQNHSVATFTKMLKKIDGHIDMSNPPDKEKIDRMIRAYYPWPGAWTKFKIQDSRFKIIKLLPKNKIQVEGKKPVNYRDFINGYLSGEKFLRKLDLISN